MYVIPSIALEIVNVILVLVYAHVLLLSLVLIVKIVSILSLSKKLNFCSFLLISWVNKCACVCLWLMSN